MYGMKKLSIPVINFKKFRQSVLYKKKINKREKYGAIKMAWINVKSEIK